MNPISAIVMLTAIAIAIFNIISGKDNWCARAGTALILLAYAVNILGRIQS